MEKKYHNRVTSPQLILSKGVAMMLLVFMAGVVVGCGGLLLLMQVLAGRESRWLKDRKAPYRARVRALQSRLFQAGSTSSAAACWAVVEAGHQLNIARDIVEGAREVDTVYKANDHLDRAERLLQIQWPSA
jgi:hypothetical protein